MTLMTPEQIQQLEAFDGQGAPVLSAYLDLDPALQPRRAYVTAFEDLVKDARQRLDPSVADDLMGEAARVRTWLEARSPEGRSLAFFSCAPRGLWEVHALPIAIKDYLAFERRPDVALLVEMLDDYERYAIALVDKRQARLFTVFLGGIEEQHIFKDFVPGKNQRGHQVENLAQRHHEMHVHWHLKHVARELADLFRRRPFDRLIIMGPTEPAHALRSLLPRVLEHRVAAVIPGEMAATSKEILERTLEVERRVERDVENRVLSELLDTVGAGGPATSGIEPTLQALWLNEVRTLVVAADVHLPGSECETCGRLEAGQLVTCPVCGGAMHATQDLFHRAVSRTIEQAGTAEVVHEDAARRLREAGGGLGAMLRFRITA